MLYNRLNYAGEILLLGGMVQYEGTVTCQGRSNHYGTYTSSE